MIRPNTHAELPELEQLIFGDEESDVFRRTSKHVESCSICQQKLRDLAASQEFETEISQILSQSNTEEHSEPGVRLDFLAPASHPEMLGRIGRYEIERVIGSGGMGIVLKGYDTELNRPVAIKVLARHLAHSGAARARFSREAKAAAAVVHEHVVSIHNVDADRDLPFLVMQFVAGESLQARVDREGPLDCKEILRIGMQVASGLAAAHEQGVVHRDVKPANILLEEQVERALITDFGLARTVDDASLTQTGIVAGTPHYMSPEQSHGDPTDQRTDLFSLGSVLYLMATGHPPFRADRAMGVLHRICHDRHRPACEVNPDVPIELSKVIDRLLEKKPSRRFASAAEVKSVLSKLLSQWQQSGLSMTRRNPVRQRMAIAVSFLILILLIIIPFVAIPPRSDVSPKSPVSSDPPGESTVTKPKPLESTSIFSEHSMLNMHADFQRVESELESLQSDNTNSQFYLPPNDWKLKADAIETWLEQYSKSVGNSD